MRWISPWNDALNQFVRWCGTLSRASRQLLSRHHSGVVSTTMSSPLCPAVRPAPPPLLPWSLMWRGMRRMMRSGDGAVTITPPPRQRLTRLAAGCHQQPQVISGQSPRSSHNRISVIKKTNLGNWYAHPTDTIRCTNVSLMLAGPTFKQHWYNVLCLLGCRVTSKRRIFASERLTGTYRRLGAKGSYLTLVRVADRIL